MVTCSEEDSASFKYYLLHQVYLFGQMRGGRMHDTCYLVVCAGAWRRIAASLYDTAWNYFNESSLKTLQQCPVHGLFFDF